MQSSDTVGWMTEMLSNLQKVMLHLFKGSVSEDLSDIAKEN